ncbi:hypothetical protein LIA77_02362 [Sarocladium implicatum]|nr:hypothetical protein LIA77_02362 [Sarocladium implicatum]
MGCSPTAHQPVVAVYICWPALLRWTPPKDWSFSCRRCGSLWLLRLKVHVSLSPVGIGRLWPRCVRPESDGRLPSLLVTVLLTSEARKVVNRHRRLTLAWRWICFGAKQKPPTDPLPYRHLASSTTHYQHHDTMGTSSCVVVFSSDDEAVQMLSADL